MGHSSKKERFHLFVFYELVCSDFLAARVAIWRMKNFHFRLLSILSTSQGRFITLTRVLTFRTVVKESPKKWSLFRAPAGSAAVVRGITTLFPTACKSLLYFLDQTKNTFLSISKMLTYIKTKVINCGSYMLNWSSEQKRRIKKIEGVGPMF